MLTRCSAQLEAHDLYTALFDLRLLGVVELLDWCWGCCRVRGSARWIPGWRSGRCCSVRDDLHRAGVQHHGLGKPWRARAALVDLLSVTVRRAARRRGAAQRRRARRAALIATHALLPADSLLRWVPHRLGTTPAWHARSTVASSKGINLNQLDCIPGVSQWTGDVVSALRCDIRSGEIMLGMRYSTLPAGNPSA